MALNRYRHYRRYHCRLTGTIMDQTQQQGTLFRIAGLIVNTTIAAVVSFATHLYDKIPYHTSALSGANWVAELLHGHPERIRCEFGLHEHVFRFLVSYLQTIGVLHSRHVFLEEQLAIFLYICVTGMSIWHVAEQFQHSNRTVSK
jgi:hypothetical protein